MGILEGCCSDATGRDGRDGFFGVESRSGSAVNVCEATQGGDECDVKAYDTGPECTAQSNVAVGRPALLSNNRVRTQTDRAFHHTGGVVEAGSVDGGERERKLWLEAAGGVCDANEEGVDESAAIPDAV